MDCATFDQSLTLVMISIDVDLQFKHIYSFTDLWVVSYLLPRSEQRAAWWNSAVFCWDLPFEPLTLHRSPSTSDCYAMHAQFHRSSYPSYPNSRVFISILDTASADLNITKPLRYTFSDSLLVALMYISVSQARSTMAIRTTGSQLGWTLTSLERRRLSVRFRPLASQKLKESKSNPSTSKNWNCQKSIEKSNK